MLNASHVVIFAAKTFADDDHLEAVLTHEDLAGRFADEGKKQAGGEVRRLFLDIHRSRFQDETEWLNRQVHINLGFTLMAAAAAGIDSVTMEGADMAVLDREFGLTERGLHAVEVVSFGYRADDDFNAALPKARLPEDAVFTRA